MLNYISAPDSWRLHNEFSLQLLIIVTFLSHEALMLYRRNGIIGTGAYFWNDYVYMGHFKWMVNYENTNGGLQHSR